MKSLRRDEQLLLLGVPVVVIVTLIGWLIWRFSVTLDDIEMRQLAWSVVGSLLVEHIVLTVLCTVAVVVTAIPLGILLTRRGWRVATPAAMALGNFGQAAPVIGVIVLLAILIGFGTGTAVLALTLYAFLPALVNTIEGLRSVDPKMVEAARGMGMSGPQVLWRIELPLALPIILEGVRTALVLLVGTATFGAFIDAGGLGELIQTGINLMRYSILVSGALLVALLALIVDWAGRVVEIAARPRGIRMEEPETLEVPA